MKNYNFIMKIFIEILRKYLINLINYFYHNPI